MGGSDQWGNITTGTELVRRKAGGEAFAFTCPLLTKSDGGKFGKTEQGNIWLDAQKTSPYHFYQFWLKSSDADAEKWIKIFTFLEKDEIESLIHEHKKEPENRLLQKRLAQELTIFVHGENEYLKAIETTEKLFSQQNASAEALSEADLESMEGIIKIELDRNVLEGGLDVVSLLAESKIFPSKGEARKMIQNGGLSINRQKVTAVNEAVNDGRLLHDKYLLIQKGKTNYYLLKLV
jgi:tyrosyl-tRNA synthetase